MLWCGHIAKGVIALINILHPIPSPWVYEIVVVAKILRHRAILLRERVSFSLIPP